jgi:hypoxanthine phosphoribosyltransferase
MNIKWFEIIFSLIGVMTSIYTISLIILDKLGYYSWFSITFRAKKLIRKIRESGYTPDIVVGLGRSGAVLGGLLAGNLGVLPITVVDRTYEWIDDKTRAVRPISFIAKGVFRGKKILLVDAAPHTGETCRAIKDELLKASPADLRIASLFKYTYTIQIPDFYIDEVQKVRKMPWRFSNEYREDFASRESS